MAWKDTLLEASFRGVVFDCISTDDSADRATAEHSYPYVDGADIEDLGRGPRHFSVAAIFFGDDYEVRLQAFLAAFDQPGPGEFIHPVFGSIKTAQAIRSSVHHEADNVDQVSVSLEFIESTPSNPFFDRSLPSQKADAIGQHGDAATASAISEIGNVVDRLHAANPLAALDTLRQAMTGPLLAGMSQVQGVLLSGMDVLAYPRAWGNDVSALVGGVLDAQDFTTNVSAAWASVQSNLTLFDVFSAPPASVPAQVNASAVPTEQQAVAAAAVTVKINSATGLASAAGMLLSTESATPTLSPLEITAIANAVRTSIESAIVDVRAIYPLEQSRAITEPLKDQALAIQDAARAIIEIRPPLIVRVMNAPGNFRLIAHRLYGDHTRAPELFRLNNIRLPNFIQQGDKLNAYAS
ncbi:DNA circulation family protein [Sulfuriferula sp. AH1]|uniref:DNA circularization protein n=1 Tax=Sulfuriferula sp. AH1 TaxID=1985873 RepID=UPI000B3B14DD|nr:DNA circularization N-terminal domain-containing protein [Sulfuriferula sp. AH1]ARU30904.1 DNA circulation family protein [Sulfuriferula sp. AH1]